MPAALELDQTTASTAGVMDSLLGTVGQGINLWNQWTTAKTANVAAKANIPTTATQPKVSGGQMVAGGIDQKTLLIGGGILAAVLAVVLLRRPRAAAK